ncbi:MAG: CPBP family intramembrane metalloprotease [Candidatus Dormibacteraeota bacterium]|uniref:CPBP family intramembrane metalloprotease n=1 Tax=Candidatus Amunia macphersoniae TaxID=3127014 RepID=A0A934NFD7_9BACT|nr:CPBP family intramembrane metalloprotease [Candidatus Dormibacteraeota bacterium]
MTVAVLRSRGRRIPLLIVAVGVATALRLLVGAPTPAASPSAGLLFGAVLMAAVVVAGSGVGPATWSGVIVGIVGGAALVAVALVGLPAITVGPRASAATFWWWVPLVSLIALSEELVLRGVLFSALSHEFGDALAVVATAALFAVIHLPLYGLGAMPVDLCVGVFLGALRVASGGVAAPAAAHVLADLATGWLP